MPVRKATSTLTRCPVVLVAPHRWMKPRVAKYMDHRGDEEEKKLLMQSQHSSSPLVRKTEGESHGNASEPASNRRAEAMLQEARKNGDEASSGIGGAADARSPGAAGGSDNLMAKGPFKLKKKTPAIEAAAKAVAAQREKAKLAAGGGELFASLR